MVQGYKYIIFKFKSIIIIIISSALLVVDTCIITVK